MRHWPSSQSSHRPQIKYFPSYTISILFCLYSKHPASGIFDWLVINIALKYAYKCRKRKCWYKHCLSALAWYHIDITSFSTPVVKCQQSLNLNYLFEVSWSSGYVVGLWTRFAVRVPTRLNVLWQDSHLHFVTLHPCVSTSI